MTRSTLLLVTAALALACEPLEPNNLSEDLDGDGYTGFDDCFPNDPDRHEYTWYADMDMDGFGRESFSDPGIKCEKPETTEEIPNWVRDPTEFDCDDENARVYPGATELCDGLDNDCDTLLSDPELDQDEDGWIGCEIDEGGWFGDDEAPLDGDCDDQDPSTHPGAAELDSEEHCMTDADGDGFGSDASVEGITRGTDCDDDDAGSTPIDADGDDFSTCDGDCDDSDPWTWPGAAELDSDTECMADADGDGWGDENPAAGVTPGSDCNDEDADLNGDDLDGDGYDTCDGDCDDTDDSVQPLDEDFDGFSTCDGDCDDADPNTYVGAAEHESTTMCMTDADADGWGDASPESGVVAGSDCDDEDANANQDDGDGDGFTTCADDCLDTDADTWPGAAIWDSASACMTDADGDGWGDPTPSTGVVAGSDCDDGDASANRDDADGDGYSSCEDDCEDTDVYTWPGAAEHESMTACMTDMDGDGYGDDSPTGSATAGTDCDDDDAALESADTDGDGYSTCDGDCDDADADENLDDVDADGWSSCDGDCHDSDADTWPGVASADSTSLCMTDADGDGWGDDDPVFGVSAGTDCDDSDATANQDDGDGDGHSTCENDCIDTDADTWPGAAEKDSATACMTDLDGDGWGDDSPVSGVTPGVDCDDSRASANQDDEDGDRYSTCEDDCDDADEYTHPGAAQAESLTDCMTDADGDGYGDSSPIFGATAGTDCDDTDGSRDPSDTDGDGTTSCEGDCDDGDAALNIDDADADGWSTCDGDCDDSNAAFTPEDWDGDGYTLCDLDCDDLDADTWPGAAFEESGSACMTDADGDGWGSESVSGGVTAGTDCDDGDADLTPDDADGDGLSTCEDDCDDSDATANPDDADGDGYSSCEDDCDDDDPDTWPGAAWEDSETECMTDYDGDGYGDDDPDADVTAGTDCDDTDDTINPGATEISGDEIDEDCDGVYERTINLSEIGIAMVGNTSDYLGISRSFDSAGDLNGDGEHDFIIGSPYVDYVDTDRGAIYIFLGEDISASDTLADADQIVYGYDSYDRLGWAVAGMGDYSGDGLADVLIGAPGDNELCGNTDDGQAYYVTSDNLLSASSSGVITRMRLDVTATTYNHPCDAQHHGHSVAALGDIDGDGWADALVGAPYEGGNDGAVYYNYGGSADWDVVTEDTSVDNVGWAVAGGDFNGDGLGDGVIASPGHTANRGIVTIFWDTSIGTYVRDGMVLFGENTGDAAGYSIDNAGDIDGDGYDDILIGAPLNDENGLSSGKIYLWSGNDLSAGGGSPSGGPDLTGATYFFYGENTYDYAGHSVAGVGDVDGDGLDDILIGAYGNDEGGSMAGAAYLVLGSSLGSDSEIELSEADEIYIGENTGDYAGYTVAGAGDINGDGLDDFFVGAPYNDDGGTDAGKLYLIIE